MNKIQEKNLRKVRRKNRTAAKISGSAKRPRMSVSRSNTSMYVQLVDDKSGRTLVCGHTKELKALSDKKTEKNSNKTVMAFELGKLVAGKAKDRNISEVVFDRGSRIYHGRVRAVAEGAREGGLKF